MAGWNPRTRSGYSAYEVVSALQKAVRRGELDNALYWAAELDQSGFSDWLWRRLKVMSVEDIGPAWPEAPAVIKAVHDQWKEAKPRPGGGSVMCIVHAVTCLVRAPKSRMNDVAGTVHWSAHEELYREIPDEALDGHTQRGKAKGRGVDWFFDESAKVEPPVTDTEELMYAELARKVRKAGMKVTFRPGRDAKAGEDEVDEGDLPAQAELPVADQS